MELATTVEYDHWQQPDWPGKNCFATFGHRVHALAAHDGLRVGDLGGGANPLLGLSFVDTHRLEYSVFDVSDTELAKHPSRYHSVVADLCSHPPPEVELDLAFSRTVCEHLPDPERFHRNVYAMLRPGGRALHFFPTLYASPFAVNRLLPERLAESLLTRIQKDRDFEGGQSKFPALYRWCRGPTQGQLKRFREIGFAIASYHGYFGHAYYSRVPILGRISDQIARGLVRRPVPALTSYASVELIKPD